MENIYLRELRRRAARLGLRIRTDKTTGGFLLMDASLNAVLCGPVPLEDIAEQLDWEEAGGDE